MAGTVKTRGIILRRRNYGEADRILTILTPTFGKLEAIAKGARRPTSKLGGHLELFYAVDWLLAEGRTWHIVTSAETAEVFPALRSNLVAVHQVSHVAQLTNRLIPIGESYEGVYRLLEQTLGAISPSSSPLILRQFEWSLLARIGSQPELSVCSHCRSALDPNQLGLCPTRGGALCPDCLQTPSTSLRAGEQVHVPISLETLKVLRLFERAPSILAPRLLLTQPILTELDRVTKAFLEHTLEAPIVLGSPQPVGAR